MIRRGPAVAISGIVLVAVSLSVAASIVPSNVTGPGDISMPSLFEGMFDEVSDEMHIMSGDTAFFSYSTLSSDVPLMWGTQILDFQPDDSLSVKITSIFGDRYGEFLQDEPVLFELLEVGQSDTLNFELENLGPRPVTVLVMLAEDLENSAALAPDSPINTVILPLAVSGFLLVLGIILSAIGAVLTLVDLKNARNNRQHY